ncbi:MAG: hypothetical protein EP330_24215 [Deltaproteobacteria bacterium]|nr:MAG: hypothetical protein EP330_24215 [Deltaproteobacteria bacterium]
MTPEPELTLARLHALRREGVLPTDAIGPAVRWIGGQRTPASWRAWLWAVCLSLGVVFTFGSLAYYAVVNWEVFGPWGQVGLAVALQAVATGLALRAGSEQLLGRLGAMAAGCLIGPVLLVLSAVTDAEGGWWLLFGTWWVLMVPSVLAARLPAAALAWLVVLDLGVIAGFEPLFRALRDLPDTLPGLVLAAVHVLALLVWEALAPRVSWMQVRWAPRTIGAAGVCLLTMTALPTLFWEGDVASVVAIPVLLAVVLAAQVRYWRGSRDLLLAGLPLLAVVVLVASGGLRLVIEILDDTLLVMAVTPVIVAVLLALTVGLLVWLRAAREWPGEAP